jgi:hypothetical protein
MQTEPTAADRDKTADYRQARGLVLAKTKAGAFRHIVGETYLVPSASSTGAGYVVDMVASTCTCPDFEERGQPCKHCWAVRYHVRQIDMPDGTAVITEAIEAVRTRVKYPVNWPAYNKSQCEEKERVEILLRALCEGIVEPRRGRGHPSVPLADAVFGATMKVYSTVSGRRATSDIRACQQRGLVGTAPNYNTLFRYVESAELTPLFQVLVEESAAPLKAIEKSFAVDSTGFSTCTYARWFDFKYGQ